ncbi:hypothetical protein F2Q70_00023810 [Brassica cretica]|uniref:Uncharacterized protein n=1 Tax=Brassica cretica TaxID=69181 RepID=A0A8S9GJT6_BRACR|nr:hypothetical protein F2Q70_00023810 [Brassica cretica]
MDNELFMNAGVLSHPSEMTSLSSSSPPAMLNWVSMETHLLEQSITRNVPRDCFFGEKSTRQSIFGSALNSLVSPPPSESNFSGGGAGENYVTRELVGDLGNIGDIYGAPASFGNGSGSCYATPMMSSPPLDAFSGDSRFAERAARFSCLGSRSFNGRRTNGPVAETASINGEMTRVSSNSALKPPAGESSGESSRKRKAKSKEHSPSTASPSPNLSKVHNFYKN